MKSLGVFSLKGGVGKTTLAVNLGTSMAYNLRKSVCLVDANMTAADLGLHFGMYSLPVTMNDVIKRKISMPSAIYAHESGVKILPSSITVDNSARDLLKIRRSFKKLDYHTLVFDTPPSLGTEINGILKIVDSALLVTTPDMASVVDTGKMVEFINDNGIDIHGIVVNGVRGDHSELTENEIELICDTKVISRIPYSNVVRKGLYAGTPFVLSHPFADISNEINKLAASLVGEEWKSPSMFEKMKFHLGLGEGWRREKREEKSQKYTDEEKVEETFKETEHTVMKELKTELRDELRNSIAEMVRDQIRRKNSEKNKKRS